MKGAIATDGMIGFLGQRVVLLSLDVFKLLEIHSLSLICKCRGHTARSKLVAEAWGPSPQ